MAVPAVALIQARRIAGLQASTNIDHAEYLVRATLGHWALFPCLEPSPAPDPIPSFYPLI